MTTPQTIVPAAALTDESLCDRAKAEGGELFPAEIVDRLLAGESPVGVYRKYRGVTRKQLAEAAPSLFAALNVATGSVIGKCYRRHRATEFLDFLKEIDRRVPDELDIHIVMDNYATHKTAAVKAWLTRRPHWYVHFTPTSASWINQVERWFAELTRKQLQRGVHRPTRQLEADIRAFIEKHNENPKPFKWTKSADDILAGVKRFCLRVDQNLCHEV